MRDAGPAIRMTTELLVGPADVLDAFYAEFKELHGRRPLALEAYQARINPLAVRGSHGSWIGYVCAREDLSLGQNERDFLAHLETTEMSSSDKLVLLRAMVSLGAFPGEVAIGPLTEEFARLSEDVRDLEAMRRLVIKNPVAAWAGGKYFAYGDGRFRSLVETDNPERLRALVLEIADWCLARYLNRSRGPICRVIQTGGKPMIKLNSRHRGELPEGRTALWVDGVLYEANFVTIALNVIRPVGGEENVLPELLRGWFGPTAGANGTRHEVQFEERDGRWTMEPAL